MKNDLEFRADQLAAGYACAAKWRRIPRRENGTKEETVVILLSLGAQKE